MNRIKAKSNPNQNQRHNQKQKRKSAPIGSQSSTTALRENVARKGGHRNQGQEKPRHTNTTCHQRGDPGLRQRAVRKNIFSKECPTFTLARPNGCTPSATTKSWTEATSRLSYLICERSRACRRTRTTRRTQKERDRRLWHDDLSSQGYRIPQTE